jgi:hypothetical protein
MPDTAPLANTFRFPVPAQATAATDEPTVLFTAPFDATVTRCAYIPEAAMTGSATARFMRLRNHGQTGALGVTIAERELVAGQNPAAFDEYDITLSATPANRDVAQGDVLEWFSDAISTGIADPGGTVVVEFTRR